MENWTDEHRRGYSEGKSFELGRSLGELANSYRYCLQMVVESASEKSRAFYSGYGLALLDAASARGLDRPACRWAPEYCGVS